uniref:Mevalonate kinase n=1 Tax=Heterorhabditis bacteriophora TaxID=37862 RepID=A0A1I7X6J1_HETBA
MTAEELEVLSSSEASDKDKVLDSPGGSCSRASNHASPMRNLSSASGGLYVSAPGKIILFGEHAVVYGKTAIAGSIDLRTYVSLFTSADGRIYLSLPDLGVEKTWLLKDLIKAAERLAVFSEWIEQFTSTNQCISIIAGNCFAFVVYAELI